MFLVASQILHWLAHWDWIQDEQSISFICLRSMLAATAHHDCPVFLSNFPHPRNEFHQIAWGISKLWLQRLYVATSFVWLGSWHSKLSAWAFRWQSWPRVQSKVEVVVKVCGWIWETSMKGIPTCRRISLTWFNHQNHWLKSLIAEKYLPRSVAWRSGWIIVRKPKKDCPQGNVYTFTWYSLNIKQYTLYYFI